MGFVVQGALGTVTADGRTRPVSRVKIFELGGRQQGISHQGMSKEKSEICCPVGRCAGMNKIALIVAMGGVAAGSMGQTCDFSSVTALCNGALAGQNVTTAVPGFDFLIMHRGVVVYHQSFGNWSLNRVANADSSSKTLSGALVMSAIENSVTPISLDSRISQFIPEFVGAKTNITMRQAFSHTAGTRESAAVSSQTLTLRQTATDIGDDVQIFVPGDGFAQPGEYFSYGGTSMHAAGAAVEVATGVPWNTLFSQRFTAANRLNMPNTRFVLTTPTNPRIAGGCESTASEFGRFMEMLRRGGVFDGRRYLSKQSVETMFSRQSPVGVTLLSSPVQISPDPTDYGVGVWLISRDETGQLRTGLAAGARGFASWIDFEDQLVCVFATDVSASGNLQQLYVLLGQAAQDAIRVCRPCDGIDFNRDGVFPDDRDVVDFFDVLAGGDCPHVVFCDIDFNNNGVYPEDQDVIDFFNVLAGGECP